ncbi:DUF1801 domain-containing protein [Flagellimonas algicola]|uniref:DUF1801 domain-containing protein n=1 Tax=Flagellimonas algicola TaxID=2583815 RepID=A0ABY2WN64_9FLAO|nr:DUF1801 domain-containing protein [Allomuricauda algicola]TMU56431.1 DUF1801 domain-containing protein [Allomuricauda algicola]
MGKLKVITHPDFETRMQNYPLGIKEKMQGLRGLVLEAVREMDGITHLEETLKWGEPSFVTKQGSTLRMDWKSRTPDQYALYFQCTSKLVHTFRLVFANDFAFEGNRAILFPVNSELPAEELKACIQATLNYHKVKHLPTLGL